MPPTWPQWAPRRRWAPVPTRSCWSAATTTRFARSPTPAATAGTNCWRATRPPRGRSIVCPYHSWSYRLDGSAAQRAGLQATSTASTPPEFGLAELRLVDWHGWLFVDPSGDGRRLRRARGGLGGGRRPVPTGGADGRRPAFLRAGHQLEGHRRELPGVLPLLDDPPGAVPDQPTDQRREPRHCTGSWMGGWMSIIEGAETMSLTGPAAASRSRVCPSTNCAA